MRKNTLVLFFLIFCSSFLLAQQNEWVLTGMEQKALPTEKLMVRNDMPKKFKIYDLKIASFKNKVSQIKESKRSIIDIPTSQGIKSFEVKETSNFSKELAKKFPNIKSYTGYQVDNPSIKVKFSKGVDGYHFQVYELAKPTFYIDSYTKDNKQLIAYERRELSKEAQDFVCNVESYKNNNTSSIAKNANDGLLRTYRIAIVTTGEYSQFQLNRLQIPNTATDDVKKEAVASAINTTMNRVNGVFERDLSVRMEVIGNNSQLIFLDTNTDNLSNTNASSLLSETQSLLDAQIGSANYDIGHAFSTGAGGLAGLGVVCINGSKGRGVTGTSSPFGDLYDIDYVAHEIGHQFGGNHTFNGTSGNCSGGNRNDFTAVEPGSGSTIMGYAGICAPQNVQSSGEDYFHSVSIAEMWNIVLSTGSCAVTSETGNTEPTADAGQDYSIPKSTPFVLKGVGSDIDDNNTLTYNWEQIDNEVNFSIPPISTNTGGAMFQSLPPSVSPNRYMPALATVVSGNTATWEVLPSVEREMNFSFTVRDNNPGGGSSARDDVTVFVVNTTPFTVTSQNTSTVWDTGTSKTITWDVGDTNTNPINCQKVNIKLSLNGGLTFPITLASEINNTGSFSFIVPDNATSNARIMVEAADNIFYDVNDVNFTINSTTPTFVMTNVSGTQQVCNRGNQTASYTLAMNFVNGFSENVTFSTENQPNGTTIVFSPTTISSDGNVTMNITNLDGISEQDYAINVVGTSNSITQNIEVPLEVFSTTFTGVTLSSPTNNQTDVGLTPTLIFSEEENATSYEVQIASDVNFSSIIESGNTTTTSYKVATTLSDLTPYYWRVKPKNDCGEGVFSEVFSFTTETCEVCTSVAGTQFETSTTLVQFNTINNSSAKPSGYSDYTNITTDIIQGSIYDLTVNANTDGNFTTRTIVWIDWNHNCSFDDEGEEYDLGTASNTPNGVTTSSPFAIQVPNNATIGNTLMRVTTKYFDDGPPSSCENGADAEVEDYTLIVKEPNSENSIDIDNYNITTFSESCVGEEDGVIDINIKQSEFTYAISIEGPSVNISEDINGLNYNLSNLKPGVYKVCIVAKGINITRCYEVIILASSSLALKLTYDKFSKKYSFNITKGTPPFDVFLDNKLIAVSSSSKFELEIENTGSLMVKTSKSCEGDFQKNIGEIVLKQNPVKDFAEIIIPFKENSSTINIKILNTSGKLVYTSNSRVEDNKVRISLKNLSKGIYFLKVSIDNKNVIKLLKL